MDREKRKARKEGLSADRPRGERPGLRKRDRRVKDRSDEAVGMAMAVLPPDEASELARVGRAIEAETGGFTGGHIDIFGQTGNFSLKSLKAAGLRPDHRLLDIGCGTLRLGYWLIRYLDPDRYFGMDRSDKYVDIGLRLAIGPELQAQKRPKFLFGKDFDFSGFGEKFDFAVARSIFSHASPRQIGLALDSFRKNSTDNAVMLASYLPMALQRAENFDPAEARGRGRPDSEWRLRRYPLQYLQGLAKEHEMFADQFGEKFNGQVWLRVSRQEIR